MNTFYKLVYYKPTSSIKFLTGFNLSIRSRLPEAPRRIIHYFPARLQSCLKVQTWLSSPLRKLVFANHAAILRVTIVYGVPTRGLCAQPHDPPTRSTQVCPFLLFPVRFTNVRTLIRHGS